MGIIIIIVIFFLLVLLFFATMLYLFPGLGIKFLPTAFQRSFTTLSIAKIKELINNDSLGKAIAMLKDLIEDNDSMEAHRMLIKVYRKKALYKFASIEIRRFIKKFKNRLKSEDISNLYHLLADSMEKEKNFSAAIKVYTALSKMPGENKLLLAKKIAICYYRLHQYDIAEKYLKKVMSITNQDTEAARYLAIIYFYKKEFLESRKLLESVLLVNKKDMKARYYLGLMNMIEGKYDQAIAEFEFAMRDKEYQFSAIEKMGQCYELKGMDVQAIGIYEKGLKKISEEDEKTISLRYTAAALYEKKREFQNALDQWRIISEVHRDYRDVNEKLIKNARFGKDRLADFKILPEDKFRAKSRYLLKFMNMELIRNLGTGDDFIDFQTEKEGQKNNILLRIYRGASPVGERLTLTLHKKMQKYDLKQGIILSASKVSPNAIRYVMDKDITIYGPRQFMKYLKYLEAEEK